MKRLSLIMSMGKRWKLSKRVSTKVIQKLEEDFTSQVMEYLEKFRRLRFDLEVKKNARYLWRYESSLNQIQYV